MPKKCRIWHPFTQHKLAKEPLEVVSGNGTTLTLKDGRVVIDAISSWWVNLHGHCHPKIVKSIAEQAAILEHVIFAEFTHNPAELLAEKLSEILPLNNIFFSDNGSTAVEVALKIAYQYHYNLGKPKKKFYCFDGGYHGDTLGAMSVGGRSTFTLPFLNLLFEVKAFPFPQNNEEEILSQIQQAIEQEGDDIAALIIEPLVQGVAGMRFTTSDFLQKLEKILKNAGILLIYDEVMTGFGRTGEYFASTRSKTTPDILCVAKGITGGFLPLSLTCMSDQIFDAFLSSDMQKTFFHGHSYTANPLCCSAALASFELLKERRFATLEAKHQTRMEMLKQDDRLENGRVLGTIAAIDLKKGKEKGYFNEHGPKLRHLFLEHGVLMRPLGSVIYMMPPYCITDDELDHIYNSIPKVLDQL